MFVLLFLMQDRMHSLTPTTEEALSRSKVETSPSSSNDYCLNVAEVRLTTPFLSKYVILSTSFKNSEFSDFFHKVRFERSLLTCTPRFPFS